MRSEMPIETAYLHGKGKFLLQIDNEKVTIVIPASAKGKYESALADAAGEYSESPSGVPYMVTVQQLPGKRNLKGVKNFDKY